MSSRHQATPRRGTVLALGIAMVLVATGCSGHATSSSPNTNNTNSSNSSLPPSTTSMVTSTTDDPRHQQLVSAATAVVDGWPAVLATAAKLVKLPPKTSPGGQPVIYDNGCHLGWNGINPPLCEFGDLKSSVTVVVTGDSHAAHWFGAFEEAAKKWGWRLVMVTKRGCPAADVHVNKAADNVDVASRVPYKECDVWRTRSEKFIRSLKPAVVVFPMLTRRGIIGASGARAVAAWRTGLVDSITAITKGTTTKVLVMSNTPKTIGSSIPQCLWQHPSNVKRCENKRDVASPQKYVDDLAATARAANAAFVDVTPWFCTSTICPVVINSTMVYRDEHHLSDKFSRMLSNHVALQINTLLTDSNHG